MNAAELAEIERGQPPPIEPRGSVPWRAFLRSGNLWLLCGMYFCLNVGWSFHLTYLPSYLPYRFHLDEQSVLGAIYSGGPLWLGAVGCLLGGLVADRLLRRTADPDRIRRRLCSASLVLAGLSWLAAIYAPNVHCFVLAVSLAAFFNDLTMPSAWAVCQNDRRAVCWHGGGMHEHDRHPRQRCRHLVDRHVRRAFAGCSRQRRWALPPTDCPRPKNTRRRSPVMIGA